MRTETPILISLDRADARARERLARLLSIAGGPGSAEAPDAPRIEGDALAVPRDMAWRTWAVLSRSEDPRILAVAYALLGETEGHDPSEPWPPTPGPGEDEGRDPGTPRRGHPWTGGGAGRATASARRLRPTPAA